jgi:hypothetical protein
VPATVGAISLLALTVTPTKAGALRDALPNTPHFASIAVVTTRDFRVAIAAMRLNGRVPPTADVRVALARRVNGSWREAGETRLAETYFWRTVAGPRAVCRLEIATASTRALRRRHVLVQLLVSPSIGCGPAHRLPLPTR